MLTKGVLTVDSNNGQFRSSKMISPTLPCSRNTEIPEVERNFEFKSLVCTVQVGSPGLTLEKYLKRR